MIRKHMAMAALISAGLFGGAAGVQAQSAMLNLPRASQHARITQRIGITDITIDYSRPLVRGRKIFGGLQAYGQVWRAGANENTTLDVTDPVAIEGQTLAKGTYGLHMIPGETAWVVILSKNATSWGSFTYDQTEDALRINVKPQSIENQEVLSYGIEDPKPDSALITMRWEKVEIPLHVQVNTAQIVAENLRKQLRGRVQFEWQPWMEAADYLLTNFKNDPASAEEAAKYAQHSIDNEDRFENEITKSRALAALGRQDEARAARNKAIAMGNQLQVQSFARTIQGDGRYTEAIELFRINIQKDPNTWIAHNEKARVAISEGDFDTAIKEMKLAMAGCPEALKAPHADLLRRLENHEDINK